MRRSEQTEVKDVTGLDCHSQDCLFLSDNKFCGTVHEEKGLKGKSEKIFATMDHEWFFSYPITSAVIDEGYITTFYR